MQLFLSGSNSSGRSSRSLSIETDPANELNDAVARAVKCFEKDNKADREFAITLAKRAYNIKNIKRYAAAKVLQFVEAKSNASTRKLVREQFEKLVGKDEESRRLVSIWHQYYSIDVEYPHSHHCHHISFGSQVHTHI